MVAGPTRETYDIRRLMLQQAYVGVGWGGGWILQDKDLEVGIS